tara:strand:- start:335 stop:637 length:303 start_codon:yes stop_codon:yes gene_type:complete
MTTPFHSREGGGGNTPSLYWKDDIDQTFRVYHIAREVYPKRWATNSKGESWDIWFLKHAGMSLDNFINWANEHKLKEKWRQSVKNSSYKTRLRMENKHED